MMAGPYRIMGSVMLPFVIDFEMKTYVCPMDVAGISAAIMSPFIVGMTDVVARPLTKTT